MHVHPMRRPDLGHAVLVEVHDAGPELVDRELGLAQRAPHHLPDLALGR